MSFQKLKLNKGRRDPSNPLRAMLGKEKQLGNNYNTNGKDSLSSSGIRLAYQQPDPSTEKKLNMVNNMMSLIGGSSESRVAKGQVRNQQHQLHQEPQQQQNYYQQHQQQQNFQPYPHSNQQPKSYYPNSKQNVAPTHNQSSQSNQQIKSTNLKGAVGNNPSSWSPYVVSGSKPSNGGSSEGENSTAARNAGYHQNKGQHPQQLSPSFHQQSSHHQQSSSYYTQQQQKNKEYYSAMSMMALISDGGKGSANSNSRFSSNPKVNALQQHNQNLSSSRRSGSRSESGSWSSSLSSVVTASNKNTLIASQPQKQHEQQRQMHQQQEKISISKSTQNLTQPKQRLPSGQGDNSGISLPQSHVLASSASSSTLLNSLDSKSPVPVVKHESEPRFEHDQRQDSFNTVSSSGSHHDDGNVEEVVANNSNNTATSNIVKTQLLHPLSNSKSSEPQSQKQQNNQQQQQPQRQRRLSSNQSQSSQSSSKPASSCTSSIQNTEYQSQIQHKPVDKIILDQNKTLNQQLETLRKERDMLQFSYKKLEVQLMQSNCQEYYQKELVRLKAEVQTLQDQNQDLKHKNFVLQNSNKQLSATETLNSQEIKKLLKSLEKSKIEATETKHQLKEKEKSFSELIKKLQIRNGQLSDDFELYSKKASGLEAILKQKTTELQHLTSLNISLEKKLVCLQKNSGDQRKLYDQQLKKKAVMINELEQSNRNFSRQSANTITSLEQRLSEFNQLRQSQCLKLSERRSQIDITINARQLQLENVRLEQKVNDLSEELQAKRILIKEMAQKVSSQNMVSVEVYQEVKNELNQLSTNTTQKVKQYEEQICELTEKIQTLESELRNSSVMSLSTNFQKSSQKTQGLMAQNVNFKEILKTQISEQQKLKQQVFNQKQQNFKVKQQLQELQLKHQNQKNQYQLLKKQHHTLQNNSKLKNEMLGQQLQGEIDSLRRKYQTLQKKLQSKVRDSKQKEKFITDFILGRSSSQEAGVLTKHLERIFLGVSE